MRDLTSTLKGKYHHVYFDNFFTSTELLTDLEWDGIYSCGTARKDRKGFLEALKKPRLSNMSVNVYVYVYVTVSKANSKRCMHMKPVCTLA